MIHKCISAALVTILLSVAGCSSYTSSRFCAYNTSSRNCAEIIAGYRSYPVGHILYSDASDTEKLQQLEDYVRIDGLPSEKLEQAAGPSIGFKHGVGFTETTFPGSGLQLRSYPDGVVYGIGCIIPKEGSGSSGSHWLTTKTNLQWPRDSEKPTYYLRH